MHLDSEAVLNLMRGLARCQTLFQEEGGVPLGEKAYVVLPEEEVARIAGLLDQPHVMEALVTEKGPELLGGIAALWKTTPAIADVVDTLAILEPEDVERIVEVARAAELVTFLRTWRENQENSSEEFWQQQLTQHNWVLSQVFAQPMVIVAAKSFVGGKSLHNTRGQIVDFLFRNKFTSNVAIVEIKTPVTRLVRRAEYRSGVHAMSEELAGAIAQVLLQRDSLQKDFHSLARQEGKNVEAFNPRCVVLAGRVSVLSDEQVRSLELVRGQLGNLQIVGFDELFARVETMLQVLGIDATETEKVSTSPAGDFDDIDFG